MLYAPADLSLRVWWPPFLKILPEAEKVDADVRNVVKNRHFLSAVSVSNFCKKKISPRFARTFARNNKATSALGASRPRVSVWVTGFFENFARSRKSGRGCKKRSKESTLFERRIGFEFLQKKISPRFARTLARNNKATSALGASRPLSLIHI